MANATQTVSEALVEALELLQRGDAAAAETALTRRLRPARVAHDPEATAAAQTDLGLFYLIAGRPDEAIAALRAGCAEPAATPTARRARVDALLHLGQALEQTGHFAEAEASYRDGLQRRAELFGKVQAGYALGLEPLAALLLRLGRAAEAEPLVAEAVLNYRRVANPRFAHALALQAAVAAALGRPDTPPAASLASLPARWVDQTAAAACELALQWEPELAARVLTDFLETVEARFGHGHPAAAGLLAALAYAAHAAHDAPARQEALRRLTETCDLAGDQAQALQAVLGLALAQSEAGQTGDALTSYADAVDRANGLGQPEWLAQALRNFGVYLAEQGRPDEAEDRLRAAVNAAGRSADHELLGRCQAALGTLLGEFGRAAEARPLLTAAADSLGATHPDGLRARQVLDQLSANGQAQAALAVPTEQLFQQYVLARVPIGLVRTFGVTRSEEEGLGLQIHLARDPSPNEQFLLEQTIREALEQFRDRWR